MRLYAAHCVNCHGFDGKGPALQGADYGLGVKPPDLSVVGGQDDSQLYVVIRDGVRYTGMPPFAGDLTHNEIWSIVTYLSALRKNAQGRKASGG